MPLPNEKPVAAVGILLYRDGTLVVSGALKQKLAMYGLLAGARDVIYDFGQQSGVPTVGPDFSEYTHELKNVLAKVQSEALLEALRDAVVETHDLKVH